PPDAALKDAHAKTGVKQFGHTDPSLKVLDQRVYHHRSTDAKLSLPGPRDRLWPSGSEGMRSAREKVTGYRVARGSRAKTRLPARQRITSGFASILGRQRPPGR